MAYSDNFEYSGSGDQDIWFDLNSDVESLTVTITNENGKVISREELGAMDAGEHSWTWDGTDVHGNPVGEGTYQIRVQAKNNAGEEVEVFSMIRGEVDGMSYETGAPIPSVNGTQVDIGDILRLETSTDSGESTTDDDEEDAV